MTTYECDDMQDCMNRSSVRSMIWYYTTETETTNISCNLVTLWATTCLGVVNISLCVRNISVVNFT